MFLVVPWSQCCMVWGGLPQDCFPMSFASLECNFANPKIFQEHIYHVTTEKPIYSKP